MKTLDEVIKAMEFCKNHCWCGEECPYQNDDICYGDDALHYLKECQDRKETLRNWTEKAISEQQNLSDAITFMQAYRDDKDDLTALRAYWKEQHENNALTWETLTHMVGKPIWLETKSGKRWGIVNKVWYTDWNDAKINVLSKGDSYTTVARSMMGKSWNAYRMERQ